MTSEVKLVWSTPHGDTHIGYIARASNPDAKPDDPTDKLIRFLIKNKHWSPFEMTNMCVEIHTERDISRQILRHRSFHFQEFSQRYAKVRTFSGNRTARRQDHVNRQNSYPVDDPDLINWWYDSQDKVRNLADVLYNDALNKGIAKEMARTILPEGLTPTKLYMNGTVRDWIHYIDLRTGNGTQREHQEIASAIEEVFKKEFPQTHKAFRSI